MTDTQQLLSTFSSIAKTLVTEHNVPHSNLLRSVREVLLTEAEKLPKIPMLYCASFGLFGYSNKFARYRNVPYK